MGRVQNVHEHPVKSGMVGVMNGGEWGTKTQTKNRTKVDGCAMCKCARACSACQGAQCARLDWTRPSGLVERFQKNSRTIARHRPLGVGPVLLPTAQVDLRGEETCLYAPRVAPCFGRTAPPHRARASIGLRRAHTLRSLGYRRNLPHPQKINSATSGAQAGSPGARDRFPIPSWYLATRFRNSNSLGNCNILDIRTASCYVAPLCRIASLDSRS